MSSSSIKVEPAEITFNSAKPGVLYVMTISVRNITTTAQRIRLQAPKSGVFALNYIPAGVIAPGLDLRAEIECQIPPEMPDNVFNDKIVAIMGNEKIDIPIIAIKPFADILFDHTVSLGNVFLNQLITKDLYFENRSDINGIVKFSLPRGSNIKLSTSKLDLKPYGTDGYRQFLRISLESKEVGTIREFLKVAVVGSVDEMHMDISAKVIEQQLTLLTENKEGLLENVQFGTIFYGERRKVIGLLVNAGPLPLSFSMKYDDEDESAANPQTDLETMYNKSLVVSPVDGIVKPFSTLPVSFNFEPVQFVPERGFTQQQLKENEEPRSIGRNVKIDCLDLNQSIAVTMQGKAQIPLVSMTPSVLRFGDCPVNDRRDIIITMVNKTKLSTTFEFPAVATFKFEPARGKILGNETVSVIASFIPPQLGTFKTTIHVSIAGGLKGYDLKIVGEASQLGSKKVIIGGTDKLPNDFIPHRKFVNPEEEATARMEKRKVKEEKELQIEADLRTLLINNSKPGFVIDSSVRPTLETLDPQTLPSVIDASKERDELYGTDPNITRKNDPNMTVQHMQFLQHQQHKKIYNEYLQKSHYDRDILAMARSKKKMLEKGAVDFSDPFGVNMGIERGLDEPVLKLPPAVEPLWMTGAGGGPGNSKGRLPVDENRLIQKKYGSSPATQAELRDCSTELSADDLKLITASHKVIDFGKVCVGSLSAKNFVVFNGLKHSVLVSIEDLEIELQQSKALTQIIPESCMAGFDIYFSSRVLGKVKKSFTWKINGIHIFKVHVLAEVVPIELTMNKTELIMEFPSDLLKPTLSADIILSNPGNAYAEYLWGSVGAFTCDPEKGSIAPGKSAVVTITWDPHGGKRTEEEIGLHVSGGVDQVLRVKGILHETKAEFSDKRLALGVMAVGTERQITTSIVNSGDNPLVFFINPLEDQLGIKLDPMEGHILPGDSMELRVTIIPKVARSYDNSSITAKVRGGKAVSLRLTGSSIIPQIEVVEDSFRFGSVTVGGDVRLPFTLKNKSQITATMILDLSSFPDFFPYLLNPLDEPDLATKEFGPVSSTQEDEIGNQVLLVSNKSSNYAFTEQNEKANGNRKSKKKAVENMWKISIPAHSILHSELIFRPSVPRKYQLRLPLNLVGMSDDRALQKDVSGLSIASALSFSSFVTDFGDRVVSRDALARVSYFLETTITNNGQTGVSFFIKEGPEILQAFDGSLINEADHASDANDSLMGGEKQQIFFVSPLKVDLAPGGTTKLRVTFLPQQNCTYSKKLGLFMKDQADQSKPYLNLLCVGSGVYPCMSFSTQHLRLLTVPLGVPSRAVFTILNHGYASLDIKHRISPNITVPIEVSYPDGNQVGIMVDRIRVVLTAKSDQPISWSGKIEFYDMDGERFFLGISGCSDNCLLANYHFIKDYATEYGFIGLDDQPVQFLPQQQIAELRQIEAKRKEELRRQRSLERLRAVEGKTADESPTRKGKHKDDVSASVGSSKNSKQSSKRDESLSRVESSKQLSYLEGIDIDKTPTTLPEDVESAFLLKWLNRNVCRKPFETEKFPSCILETTGDIVIDCLEQMSGKKLTNLTPQERRFGEPRRGSEQKSGTEQDSGSNKRSSEKGKQIAAADKIVFKYQQILNFLINHGALLSHINPVALLNRDEHLLIQEHDITKDKSVHYTPAMLASRRQIWTELWLDQCKRAWLEVLYQGVKVFILSRLNYKEFMVLPGVVLNSPTEIVSAKKDAGKEKIKKKEKENIPKHLQSSNVFTHGESILLAWLSYHLDHADHCVDEGAKGTNPDKLISFSKRVVDVDGTFKDFYHFCQLMHSHVSDITQKGEPLHGYTSVDRSKQDILYACFEEALLQYRCEIPNIAYDEIVASSRNILLMLLHMYLSLPHLIPKAKVDFTGVLGIPIAKKIELKNSAKKPLNYEVSIKGNPDFQLEAQNFIIPAESASEFLVTLNAHFMHQVKAKLYFWNIRDPATLANGATLCFQCVSQITGMKPVDVINRNVHLFDYEHFPLQVRNPYPRDVVLHVKLEVKYCAKVIHDFVGSKPKKGSRNFGNETFVDVPITKPVVELQSGGANEIAQKNANDDWDLENLYRQPFWIQEETIAVPKGGMRTMKVSMLPFLLGKYVCQVVFVDAEQGEFCHEINADVGLPKPADRLDLNILQGSKVNILLTFNSKNPAFEKAYGVVSETRIKNANKKIRARAIFQNLMSTVIQNDETGQSNFLLDFTANFFAYKRPVPFLSEYLKWPVKPVVGNGTKEKDNNQNTSKFKRIPKTLLDVIAPTDEVFVAANYEGINKSLLAFTPERAGVYKTTGVVYAEDNPCDIRCVELSITARVPDAKMMLEFNGPARKKLIQDIPIMNETDSDWTLTVGVGTGNKDKEKDKEYSLFSQKPFTTFPKKTLIVPKHGQANLQVFFYSCIAGNFQGKLQLRNVENNDVFDYTLMGVAEDTLAEDHYHFSCTARRKANFSIPLPSLQYLLNPDMDAKDKDEREVPSSHKFLIESDLPYMNSLKTVELHMDDQSPINLNFSINSPVGGMLSGYIGLRDSDPHSNSGLLLWYTVNVDITAPKEEKSIEVEATVRTAVSIAITLSNPINEELVFDVSFIGDGLFGDSSFVLPPKESSTESSTTYELVYSPLIAGTFIGKVSFWNETLGDLWYKLILNAKPAPPMELELIESMLGSDNFIEAPVENPSKDNIVYHIEISDPEHFSVQYPKIALSPFMQTTLKIFFRPSMLNEIVSGTVRLLNHTVGEAVYSVRGKGLLPGVMPPVTVEGPLHEIVSESIVFKNPFPHPLPMEVLIDKTTTSVTTAPNPGSNKKNQPPPTEEGVFSLLMRKSTDLVLAAKTPLHIPVGFSPKHLGIYNTTVQVRATVGGHNLLWCFPVQGIAEMGQVMKLPPMKASSKTSVMKEYVLPMSGIRKKDVNDDLKLSDFSIILKMDDELLKNLVSRSFRIQPLEIVAYQEISLQIQNNPNMILIHNNDPTVEVDFGLRCRFLFEPLRVFTTPIDVSIVCRNRGKWKAKIEIEATDPEPDDIIKLVASVNSVDRVSFKLHNRFLGYSKFQAYFTSNSSPHFSVTPTNGTLPPFNNEQGVDQQEGVNFVITFAPKEYGVVEAATLNILTEDAQWTYLLKGSYPDNSFHTGPLKNKASITRR